MIGINKTRNINLIDLLILFFLLCVHTCWAKIDISPKKADLGKIIQGKPINYIFLLQNHGNKRLNIKKITPD
ncbi:MAG: hypothetical protein DRG39_08135 [Deltaproteobacteria bacterium]|nr:MAG: hypothetical protein DRG39_08135 [Deltaproteobacteria bacterium]